MKNKAFTLVELLAIIVIMASMLLIILPSINGTIKNSEEKKKQETLNSIYMAAENYVMANYDEYSSLDDIGAVEYVYITDLISNNYLSIDTVNPNNDLAFNNKDVVKVTKKEDGTFEYELIVAQIIYDVVINNFPYLEVGENGCKNPGDNNYSYMGGCYLKGNPNNNYVWYSGFLWRIMGINADKTVKMITDENITAIPWGKENTAQSWDESHAKDWLNNYFYNRLKGNNIISEQMWCSEIVTDSSSARTTCINNLSKEKSKVGLITLDEYNLAGGASSYLNIEQRQWTMTPCENNLVWTSAHGGIVSNLEVVYGAGLRPTININPSITIIEGDGTIKEIWNSKTGPYILNENKIMKSNKKLNKNATSGEYVMLAGKKYRVVDKDSDGNTKLLLDGYYEEKDEIFNTSYGNDEIFTKSSGVGLKLNTDVLNWLVASNDTINRDKLVIDYTWYQNVSIYGDSYKISLNEINPTRSIKATVGLIRIGEMLSSQSSSILTKGYTTTSNYNNTKYYWTMTPRIYGYSWVVDTSGYAYVSEVSPLFSLRPVIVIKSDVEIISGTGTFSNPYQI